MYADSSRLTLFSFFTVARDRPGETSEAEGSMGAPVLQYDVSFPHCSLHLPLLMNRYFSRNWRKVANKSISSEHLMTFSLTSILLTFKQSTLTKPSSAHARGETLSGLRGPPHRTAYLLSPRKFQFFNLISFILPFFVDRGLPFSLFAPALCLITQPSFHYFFIFVLVQHIKDLSTSPSSYISIYPQFWFPPFFVHFHILSSPSGNTSHRSAIPIRTDLTCHAVWELGHGAVPSCAM